MVVARGRKEMMMMVSFSASIGPENEVLKSGYGHLNARPFTPGYSHPQLGNSTPHFSMYGNWEKVERIEGMKSPSRLNHVAAGHLQ